MKKPSTQIALISLLFVAIYFGLRALPVESCEFLHYGDYVNAEGVIEGCGYEETNFFDMNKLKFPILAEVQALGTLEVGKPTLCMLTLTTTTGKSLTGSQITISHTERIHAMVVDPSLNHYDHLHPTETDVPGKFFFTFTPRSGGTHPIYLDFIPLTNSRRTLLKTSLHVNAPSESNDFSTNSDFLQDDISFNLATQESIQPNKLTTLTIVPQSRNDEALVFAPVMGSYAHMVAFDEQGRGFAHLHPTNPLVEGQDPQNPSLEFSVEFDQPGHYRIWAQMNINGIERFIPFTISVEGTPS